MRTFIPWLCFALGAGSMTLGLHAGTFIEGPTLESLAPSGPAFLQAVGVTNAGVAVGYSDTTNAGQRVVRFSAASSTDLPAIGVVSGTGSGYSSAVDVSADGTIVGISVKNPGTTSASNVGVYWDAGGIVHELQTPTSPSGGKSSVSPRAISRYGQIAAESSVYSASGPLAGMPIVRFDSPNAPATILESIAPVTVGSLAKHYALGINAAGTIVGYANPNGALVPRDGLAAARPLTDCRRWPAPLERPIAPPSPTRSTTRTSPSATAIITSASTTPAGSQCDGTRTASRPTSRASKLAATACELHPPH